MKNVYMLVVGFACLAAMICANSLIKPQTITAQDLGGISKSIPCDCYSTKLNLVQASYNDLPYSDGKIRSIIDWTTNHGCNVKVILVAAPVWYSENSNPCIHVGDEVSIGSEEVNDSAGYDPISGLPTIQPDEPYPSDYKFIGWQCRAYMVRTCDNTLIGWSDTVMVLYE